MSSTAPNWAESNTPEWAKALPLPKSNPGRIDASDVAELIHTKEAGVDFVVVDLRKADWEVLRLDEVYLVAHGLTALTYFTDCVCAHVD